MPDLLDHAKDLEMAQRAQALKQHQQRTRITDPPLIVDGVRLCIDCEEPIPKERLAAQPESVRCVDCKADHERGLR